MKDQGAADSAASSSERIRPFLRVPAKPRLLPFWRDRRGVAALEFALLAPLLIFMYFLSMEVSQAVETSKKVSRIGSMIADLVTQQPKISRSELDAILKIGKSLLQPYKRSDPTIIVSGIQITNETNPKVLIAWSRKLDGTKFSAGEAKNTPTTVPDKLKVAGSFLVRVESRLLPYKPVLTWSADDKKPGAMGLVTAFSELNMSDTYYLRPRMSDTVPCSDC